MTAETRWLIASVCLSLAAVWTYDRLVGLIVLALAAYALRRSWLLAR